MLYEITLALIQSSHKLWLHWMPSMSRLRRIQEEANRKRSEAAKQQPRTEDGTKLAEKPGKPTSSGRTSTRWINPRRFWTSSNCGRRNQKNAEKITGGCTTCATTCKAI